MQKLVLKTTEAKFQENALNNLTKYNEANGRKMQWSSEPIWRSKQQQKLSYTNETHSMQNWFLYSDYSTELDLHWEKKGKFNERISIFLKI